MEPVTFPAEQIQSVNILPLIYLIGAIILTACAIPYFIRLGRDVRAIRKLLEKADSESDADSSYLNQ